MVILFAVARLSLIGAILSSSQFRHLWRKPERYNIFVGKIIGYLQSLMGKNQLNLVQESGGKVLITNHPISLSGSPGGP
jgi:hypothetical protein